MKPKLLVCLLISILFLFVNGNAGTIVVTSNADSGPGTLREAITTANANGTSTYDTIVFNIADITRSGRTIILNSELPELTSKIIIDASSQAGNAIGVSDAKIIILINTPQQNIFTIFKFNNASNIEFYGLFLFNEVFTIFSNNRPVYGIIFTKSNNIIIGKPGKGNYFRGLRTAISSNIATTDDYYLRNSIDITIQSNIFNNNENGEPTIYYPYNTSGLIDPIDMGINLINTKNIKIGGDQQNEGNVILAEKINIKSNVVTDNGFLIIKNNFMGIHTNGSYAFQSGSARTFINITGNYSDRLADYDVSIIKNRINGRIEIHYLSKYLVITGNKIFDNGGNGSSINYDLKVLVVLSTAGGIIGGETIDEQNEIFTFGPMNIPYAWSNIPTGALHVAYSPKIMIRKNKTYCTARYGAGIQVIQSNEPFIRIDSTGSGFVRGKATPNCTIEVFLDDDCWACDGEFFLGQTVSSSDSNWNFSGNFNGVVIATATLSDSTTSGYTEPTYRTDSVKIKQPTCGQTNGSIKGMKPIHSFTGVEWHKTFVRNNVFIDTLITTNSDLINVGPGFYYFIAKLGETCRSAIWYYTLTDITPAVDETNAVINHPSCGLFNGSVYGLNFSNQQFSIIEWKDELGNVISNSTILIGVGPGRYKAYIRDTTATGGCVDSTGWFDLINQAGPTLNTNNIQLTNATCGNANGSITGITTTNVTGTPFIQWLDSLNNPVGSSLNLTNIPAGKYKLKFKDQSGCDTIITPFYTIQSLGVITMDTSQLAVTSSQCAFASGSITGINVQGATNYQWINASGQTVSNSLSPGPVYPGSYTLIASNQYGCTKQTNPIIILPEPQMSFNVPVQIQGRPGLCDSLNGYINIVNFPNPQNYTFRWVDSLNPTVTISTSLNLTGFNSGTFILYAKNAAGCEQRVTKEYAPYLPPPVINSTAIITDEVCNNQMGSIQGVTVSPGTGMQPFTYTWYNSNNNVVSNQQNLSTVQSGSYTLIVTDNFGCKDTSNVLQIKNTIVSLNTPKYDDQYIRINTSTTLSVLNPQPGTYLLFDSPNSTSPSQQNVQGIFTTPNLTADKIYYIQLVNGSCVSSKVAVKIYVYDKTNVYVPSGFTPNNDGKNDILKVKAYGIVTLEYFRVYNKYGQLVFSTSDISKGWDGTVNGMPQPISVYVWMVRAKDEITGEFVEKKGTVTVIR